MVVIAVIVLVVLVAVIWKFTLGKTDGAQDVPPEDMAGQPDPGVPADANSTPAPPVPGAPEAP